MKSIKHLLSLSALITINIFSNIGPQGFGQFKNYYFVETGTYSGDGIAKALKAGFTQVLSIEYQAHAVQNARKRFARNPNVQIFHGNSSKDLWNMIKDIDQEITFWLDAHIYPPRQGVQNCPLIEELEQIKQHPIKTHTILIDDMHCAGTHSFDYLTKDDLINKILEINPDYQISYVDGGDAGEYKDNVMVATIS